MSFSEDASIRQYGDLHWVPSLALALWISVECLCNDCKCSEKGLHLSQLLVSSTCYELVLPFSHAARWRHPRWHTSMFPSSKVLHRWRVWLWHPADTDYFYGVRSLGVILPDLLCGVRPFRAVLPLNDSLNFWFHHFFCWPSSTPSLRTWIHSYSCYIPWVWVCYVMSSLVPYYA